MIHWPNDTYHMTAIIQRRRKLMVQWLVKGKADIVAASKFLKQLKNRGYLYLV